VSIAIDTEADWKNFCTALGAAEWLQDKRFADKASRLKHREELDKLIAAKTTDYDKYDITNILQKVNVAATPVLNCEDQLADPHFIANKTFYEIQHPIIGKEIFYSNPSRLSDTPPAFRHHAPGLGENNDYILTKLLGYSQQEVADLVKQQIIF
jgi:crotonobetainyl-CoA:carnitine CoA-transferase CaiB-like acyl-CoA transferase